MKAESTGQRTPAATPRRTLRDELFGPPHQSRWAQVRVIGFGLLMVVSVVIPAVSAAEVPPGLTLMFAGLMFQSGVAEMLDVRWIRFAVILRFAGAAIAVAGLMLQLL